MLPAANFSASNVMTCLNTTVTFEDESLKYPTNWSWSITPSTYSFVNSTTAASQNPQVSFSAYGSYTVQLIASNIYGSDTIVRDDYITVNAIYANFIANSTSINVGNTVTFTDQSTCNITSYLWNSEAGLLQPRQQQPDRMS